MTVEPGRPWGRPGALPADGVEVHSDTEARRIVEQHRRAGRPVPALGLLGGDLCRTLGGTGDPDRLRGPDATTVRIDLGRVEADGAPHWFVAHLVARRRGWRGRAAVVMNAEWLGALDLGPRAHPGDGLLDVTEGALPAGQLLQARRRARTGTHLPHPALRTSRSGQWATTFDAPRGLWLDGERVGRVRHLVVGVEPAAITVVV